MVPFFTPMSAWTISDPSNGIYFVYSCVIDDEGICDDHVQTFIIGPATRLAHAISQDFSTSKLALVAIHSEVFLDPNPQVGVTETHYISSGRTKHICICLSVHFERRDLRIGSFWLGSMAKFVVFNVLHDLLDPRGLYGTRCNAIAALNNAVSCDLH
jgi:hypothetical protein